MFGGWEGYHCWNDLVLYHAEENIVIVINGLRDVVPKTVLAKGVPATTSLPKALASASWLNALLQAKDM